MITFKTLRWKNLLSTGNVFTEVNLNTNKTTLIVGENGAGKSTILDALSFSLFGKPFRKVKKNQLLNTITQKGLVTEIEFSIGKNKYKVVRGVKPDIFEIYHNGKLLQQSAASKDYQEMFETQILRLNHKSFCQVVVLGSASFVPFMQLSALNRREIIEDLLDLQIFTTMNLLLKDKVATNQESLSDVSSQIKANKTSIETIKEHIERFQKSNDDRVAEKKQKIRELCVSIEDHSKEISQKKTEIDKLRESVANGSVEALADKLTKLNNYQIQLKTKLSTIQKTIDFFDEHDDCPTCRQNIAHDFKTKMKKSKQTQLDEVNNGLKKLAEERSKVVEKYNLFEKIEQQIVDLQLDISQLKQSVAFKHTTMTELEKDVESLTTIVGIADNNKIEELEKKNALLEQEYNELSEEKAVYGVAAKMLKDGGIKSKIVKQYVPVINKLINKYLSAMDFFVQFELDENFEETIKSRFRDEFSYASFSEGEKMRINLAILFTWRAVAKLRNSASTNLLIMDEVLDSSLDLNGTDEFLKLINSLTQDTNTFVISHKADQLYDKFEKVIKFEKHKNFSRIA